MQITRKSRLQLMVHHGLFVVLLVAAAALLAYLSREYRVEHDLTRSHRNTLSAATLDVLKQMDGPLTVTAYAMARDARGEHTHRRIEEFIAPYQRAKPDLTLSLVDPREQPKAAAQAGVRAPLELVVEFKRRSEHLTEFNEKAFANVLMRLARGTERLVLWLDGHGERKLNGTANHDLGEFGRLLESKGFRLSGLNLAIAQDVPGNAAMLVIANPQVDLLPAEVEKIRRHVAGGGNLLWLIDPEPLRGLAPVAEMFGLVLTPGVVVDPNAARLNASPTLAVAAAYGRHAITDGFSLVTVFPQARQIGTIESDVWRSRTLVEAAPRGCVKTGKPEGGCDRGRDTPGPVAIAMAFERAAGDKQQRVVVVGNGGFLSNTFLGNGGNRDLGVNIVNWLATDDKLIALQPRTSADSNIDIDQVSLYLIAFLFLFVVPLAFVITGAVIWWRRRRI
ncbi:MAG: ABC transporter [Betaproteobacteria bacterium RIFCSPLOWO2_02_FULL_67_26]|nr:MAG: ABC transporter [Betaproteobacteria bacterium RIFCSPLOWO2_02_FULL_67_26]